MKYLDYMSNNPDANFDWCKPYSDGNNRYLIIYDGIANAIYTPDTTAHRYDGYSFDEALEVLAREVNPYYDLHIGYTDKEIALMAMHETGCASCPFRHECEAMMEEVQ